ncbi:endonuclease/exonuclease/phosphatase family protein [Paenibacillus larvae]|uniref:Exodeoxyribonuclease III (Xth) n=2 Tax=Paenibacillus larvae TaxID=1464 RepID=A0A6C0QU63_9BACL|nr:endonuclease/exonuclease/phosphatase family protein [Paenibacillus larvae]AQR79646.1 hypothetical protein BXP28_05035 [Paenibacillus larvae subsp. larvae]AVF22269.1 exodeoxyribonuclease III (xth) [Paenibacillus larvae subsp. larvae]ETK26886.1 hypothetical protein ERIC1_1c03210 [Paenibacillus larvae subsp. larvae DSM 25719]MCY7477380.1 endonuclease/exonuclease/phosphatase family protein [Paenibacillus larvae]MCY7491513.1 endonuclease/exonuclease/phosphatase family protein [Paenibacillus larv
MEFRVVTFNIHHGRGTDRKLNLDRIAQVIEKSQADVIALNEVDKYFSRRSEYTDQLGWLSERLKLDGIFGAAKTNKVSEETDCMIREYGNALLSRFPIVDVKNHNLSVYPIRLEGRALLEVTLLIGGQWLKLYVTHLSLTPFIQSIQADMILNKIIDDHHPMILLGDFNTWPQSKLWRKVTAKLTDVSHSFRKKPCLTFPSFRPRVRLDYIFISHHFHISSAEVITEDPAASDHLPLIATLKF